MPVDLMDISKSGLMTASQSMKNTGHNIANVNTKGYSRKISDQVTSQPLTDGNLIMGSGAYIRSVERVHNDFIEKKINKSMSDQKFYAERYRQLSALDEVFNEINTEGIAQTMNHFFNSFRELSGQPENQSLRSMVRDRAVLLLREIHTKNEILSNAVTDFNQIFEETITDANSLLGNISKLNLKILELEQQNGETGDLRDERDLHLRNLSEVLEVNYYTDEKGRFIVTSPGMGVLVTAGEYKPFRIGVLPDSDEVKVLFPQSKDIFIETQQVGNSLVNGKMAALIKTRQHELSDIKNELNDLAYSLARIVNSIHQKGFINRPVEFDEEGNPVAEEKITNIDFFKLPSSRHSAAEHIELSDWIKKSSDYICTAAAPNVPGDNTIALAVSKLSHTKVLSNETKTLEEKFLEMVGQLSLTTAKAQMDMEQNEGLVAQLDAIKERITGVSLDEETTNLIRYQHAYEASARVMRIAQENMDTLLSLRK